MKIAIFYHVYQYTFWKKMFDEQISLLEETGLLERSNYSYIGVNGDYEIKDERFVINHNTVKDSEAQTLFALSEYAKQNKDSNILYFHTKGISHPSKTMNDWRKMMEYFCIEKWQDCIRILKEYDSVGCNLFDTAWDEESRHYSGNFWWAKGSYINTCDNKMLFSPRRFDHECWIGSGKGRMFEAYDSVVDLCFIEHPRENYQDHRF